MLRGAMKLIERDKPVLMLEMLRKWAAKFGYHPNDIIEMLAPLGYSCWYCEQGSFHRLKVVDEDTVPINFFFLHESHHSAIIQQWSAGLSLTDWAKSDE